jgi:hypothetical protein
MVMGDRNGLGDLDYRAEDAASRKGSRHLRSSQNRSPEIELSQPLEGRI